MYKRQEVRGAPLIGATAAYGLVLSIIERNDQSFLKKSSENLIKSRPTAINLKWAVDRMMKKLSGVNSKEILNIAIDEARAICDEDIGFCKNIGLIGLKIIVVIYKMKKDLFNFRFQKVNTQVTNPSKIQETKKNIARLKTLLKEKLNA